jgi:hypothetical protein
VPATARGEQEGTLTLQRWIHPVASLALVTGTIFTASGCPADDGEATASDTESADPTGNDDDDDDDDSTATTTAGDEDPTEDDSLDDSTTIADDDTADPTTDTEGTNPIECDTPGTETISGNVYIGFEGGDDISVFEGVRVVDGDIQIQTQDITSLDFLVCLEEITGDIQIFDTAAADIGGLKNLTVLGGSISISGNPNLEWIYGLDGLVDLPGNVIITETPARTRISGFGALEQIHTSLRIDENPVLTTVDGFAELIVLYDDLSISFNENLQDLSGPANLKALGDQCVIKGNTNMCISEAESVCGDLKQWEGEGDTTANDNSC